MMRRIDGRRPPLQISADTPKAFASRQPPLRLFVGDHETFNRLAVNEPINYLWDVRDCDVPVKKVVGFD
jgi:hypothetical protein